MKLKSITLENFRQFYGCQTLHLASAGKKNVTVVFGANGAGKTALLNAFVWALYEDTTPAFEQPESIVCARSLNEVEDEKPVPGRVTVVFEHEGREYTVRRSVRARRMKNGEVETSPSDFHVSYIDEGGETVKPGGPQNVIEKVLPHRLYNFFFFDGERIEELAKPTAYEEIEEAIKNILGITVIERGIRHLGGEVTRRFEKEWKDAGQRNVEDIIDELDVLREEKRELEEREELEEGNVQGLKEQLKAVNRKLRLMEEAKQLQTRRESVESDLESVEANISTSHLKKKVHLKPLSM
jgi:DNA sulfur modification protein DndD